MRLPFSALSRPFSRLFFAQKSQFIADSTIKKRFNYRLFNFIAM